ncbi:uncharacterized protein ALTATR162_LOCUS10890 [Alternaria atra]|uniref:DUF3533 domain-containing protein n=1 Tax=Alternaria atra TaxID=119953 RepID=A0A8J2IAI6_9PLEO|nr:uncharacterized protein ALTATR162_LOCUS10890 [Alternaria atra]CAG5184061.1 unnamed protein product [Alternaria atra]
MSQPMLGCQIAPQYHHEYDSSSSGDSDTGERALAATDSACAQQEATIFQSETNNGINSVSSRPTTLQRGRTKSSRRIELEQKPVGFFHSSMAGVRLHVIKLWFRTNLILAIAIMAFLCLFWGALFRQNANVKSLSIWVVDFDGQPPYAGVTPFVGPFVTQAIHDIIDEGGVGTRQCLRLSRMGAVIINPNATAMLEAAVRQGNASYDPLGACQIIYNSARDQTTSSTYILPSMNTLQKRVVTDFGRAWITHLLQNNLSVIDMHVDVSPQALAPGIEFAVYDLRPFGPSIATPAYLSPRGHPPLHFYQLIIWRYVATVASYFLLSLVYSLVSLAFLMPMDHPKAAHDQPANNPNAYGSGTFVVYWMVNWIGMTAFGLASENMAMLLGTPGQLCG